MTSSQKTSREMSKERGGKKIMCPESWDLDGKGGGAKRRGEEEKENWRQRMQRRIHSHAGLGL
jgi:hypothetical protein